MRKFLPIVAALCLAVLAGCSKTPPAEYTKLKGELTTLCQEFDTKLSDDKIVQLTEQVNTAVADLAKLPSEYAEAKAANADAAKLTAIADKYAQAAQAAASSTEGLMNAVQPIIAEIDATVVKMAKANPEISKSERTELNKILEVVFISDKIQGIREAIANSITALRPIARLAADDIQKDGKELNKENFNGALATAAKKYIETAGKEPAATK